MGQCCSQCCGKGSVKLPVECTEEHGLKTVELDHTYYDSSSVSVTQAVSPRAIESYSPIRFQQVSRHDPYDAVVQQEGPPPPEQWEITFHATQAESHSPCKTKWKRNGSYLNLDLFQTYHQAQVKSRSPCSNEMYQDDAQSQQEQSPPMETCHSVQKELHSPYNSKLHQDELQQTPPDQCHPVQKESHSPCNSKIYEDEVQSIVPTDVSTLELRLEPAFPDSYETIIPGNCNTATAPWSSTNVHASPLNNFQEPSVMSGNVKEEEATSDCYGLSLLSRNLANIISCSCDQNGGVLLSKYGDLKLTVPKGAIKKGDLVTFSVLTSLFAPFILPSRCQTDLASPYYWVRASGSYHFKKSIQVEFQHFAVVTACDPSHYQLLTCEDDDESHIMRPVDCVLHFKMQGEISWCTFYTDHFCSYCLFCNCQDPKINRIGAYFLKPKDYQILDRFTVEIWFSFPIPQCLERNKELYTSKDMILDSNCSWIFEASSDKSSTSYFGSSYDDQRIDGWQVDYFRYEKIRTREVNFYNYYTNQEDLEAIENLSLFPPRFILDVEKKSDCKNDLNRMINVTFFKAEGMRSVKSIPFKLFVPITAPMKVLTTTKILTEDNSILHQCNENMPELKDLMKFLTKISLHWQEIGFQLGIPEGKVSTINLDYQRTEEKCLELFKEWLRRTRRPCWCNFIQALFAVGLNGIAEEAKTHLKLCKSVSVASSNLDISDKLGLNNIAETKTHLKPCESLNVTSSNLHISEKMNADDLYQLKKFLIDIPDCDLNYFISRLLSKDNTAEVMKDIRCSGGSKKDNINKICHAFSKEKEPSWTKVHVALIEAECYDLANTIKIFFLPI